MLASKSKRERKKGMSTARSCRLVVREEEAQRLLSVDPPPSPATPSLATPSLATLPLSSPPLSSPPLSSPPLSSPPSVPSLKFRYIIYGVARNKHYTIEEAQWCDRTSQFVSEQVHTVNFALLKRWLGYIPSMVGDLRTTMWMCFPSHLQPTQKGYSPLLLWQAHPDWLVPLSLEKFRHFPHGSCQEQASQVPSA